MEKIELLLSLPPAATDAAVKHPIPGTDFVCSDPPGCQLGSGGGTAFLLNEAVKRLSPGKNLHEWLSESRKMIIHGSGQSRRLPGYAAEGKPLMPLPLFSHSSGQAPERRLLDLQKRYYDRLFWHAPEKYRLMIACGDVLIRNDDFPPIYPDADVLIVGLEAPPDEACNHGVMFCPADDGDELSFFLQKPLPSEIIGHSHRQSYYLDTGIWLFSERALQVLMSRCGWDDSKQCFRNGHPDSYDLYDQFGLSLGSNPHKKDAEVSELSSAVLPLQNGRFYHFGTNRSILASTEQLQSPIEKRRSFGHGSLDARSHHIVINSSVDCEITEQNRNIWIENCTIPSCWSLTQKHILTGIPSNQWEIALPAGICVDIMRISDDQSFCARPYGFDDPFRGSIGSPETLFLGDALTKWLESRGIDAGDLSSSDGDNNCDIQNARLFPAVNDIELLGRLLKWMISDTPDAEEAEAWRDARRLSAAELGIVADVNHRQVTRR